MSTEPASGSQPDTPNADQLQEARHHLQAAAQVLARLEARGQDQTERRRLETDLANAQVENDRLRAELASAPRAALLKSQLESLRRRIYAPGFWRSEFIEPFAFSLDELDQAHQNLMGDMMDPAQVIHGWQLDLLAAFQAPAGTLTRDQLETLRVQLLAQWTVVRWLEVVGLEAEE